MPLELPHRNVFISYNFEANYNLPWHAHDLIPGILEKFEGWEEGLFQKGEEGRAHVNNGNSSIEEEETDAEVESTTTLVNDSLKEKKQRREIRAKEEKYKYARPSLISRKSFYSLLHEKFK